MAFDTRLLGGLSILGAVVDAGSFVRAGDALNLTQSGVSRAVQRLEQQLGVRLLDRTSRAVSLTDEGRRFYDEVMPLLERLEAAAEGTAKSSRAVRGKIRVNADSVVSRFILGPNLGKLLNEHPELEVEIDVLDHLGDMVADRFDVAVRFGEPEPSTLIARRLARVRVITLASREYLARRGTPRHPKDLEKGGHDCLHFRDPVTRRAFPWEFHKAGKVLPVAVPGRVCLNDGFTQEAACVAGCGIAQFLDVGMDAFIAANRLVRVLPDWTDELYPLYVYHPSRHHAPAKLRAFLDFVSAAVKQMGLA
jgi:DNA-binding transcriptional LysR family regulator